MHANAIATLGLAYKRLNRKDEALEAYKKALKYSPNDNDTMNNIGTILYEKGEYEKAAEEFLKALQVKPDDVETLSNLGCALVKVGKHKHAWVAFEEAIKISPANVPLIENFMLCLLDGKAFEEFDAKLQKLKLLNTDTKLKLQEIEDEYKKAFGMSEENYPKRSSTGSKQRQLIQGMLSKKGKSKFGDLSDLAPVPEEN